MRLGVDFVSKLPFELAAECINNFTLEQVLPLCLVSTRWRKAALDVPAYWRSIALKSLRSGALQFFFLRLRRTLSRRFQVRIDLGTDVLPVLVLLVLGTYMSDITELEINARIDEPGALLDFLSVPAPLLECLILGVTTEHAPIAKDLFSGVAPALSDLWFHDTTIDLNTVKPLLSVRTLIVHTVIKHTANEACLFTVFPNVQQLRFRLNTPLDDPVYARSSTWKKVEWLFLSQQGAVLDDILKLPINGISHISAHRCDEGQAFLLLKHLGHDETLELSLDSVAFSTHSTVAMHFRGLETHRVRSISQPSLNYWQRHPSIIPSTLASREIILRITHLTLTTAVWRTLVQRLPWLPNLRLLRAVVQRRDFLSLLPPLPLQERLRAIVLRAETGVWHVSCDDLRRFAILSLREYFRAFPLTLHLEHVVHDCPNPQRDGCARHFRLRKRTSNEDWFMPPTW